MIIARVFSLDQSTPDRRSAQTDSVGDTRRSSVVRIKQRKKKKQANPIPVKHRFDILAQLEECDTQDNNVEQNSDPSNTEGERVNRNSGREIRKNKYKARKLKLNKKEKNTELINKE